MNRDTLSSQTKRAIVWLVAIGILVAGGIVIYFGTPLTGSAASIDRVENDPTVTVTEQQETYTIEPATGDPEAGLVFYPGGRVHPDAYLASLAPLASEANVTVVVPKMPLNLAVLHQNAASAHIDDDIDRWYVGGHSLGGAMACRYAHSNPDRVDGLVLFASYCDRDVSETELAGLSVIGSTDTVLDHEAYDRNRGNLPAETTEHELDLNHSQFGSYRGQSGDQPSGIDYETAHEQLAAVIVPWFDRQTGAIERDTVPIGTESVSRSTGAPAIGV